MNMAGLTSAQKNALDRVKALRNLSKETGMKTTRSQNEILQALPPTDLAVVAVALQADQAGR
jgi:hypothetical protein